MRLRGHSKDKRSDMDGAPMAEEAFEGSGNIVGVGLGIAEDGSLGAEPGLMKKSVILPPLIDPIFVPFFWAV